MGSGDAQGTGSSAGYLRAQSSAALLCGEFCSASFRWGAADRERSGGPALPASLRTAFGGGGGSSSNRRCPRSAPLPPCANRAPGKPSPEPSAGVFPVTCSRPARNPRPLLPGRANRRPRCPASGGKSPGSAAGGGRRCWRRPRAERRGSCRAGGPGRKGKPKAKPVAFRPRPQPAPWRSRARLPRRLAQPLPARSRECRSARLAGKPRLRPRWAARGGGGELLPRWRESPRPGTEVTRGDCGGGRRGPWERQEAGRGGLSLRLRALFHS